MAKPHVFKAYILIVCLVVSSMAMSGCEPLRKKFTRQKKNKAAIENDFVPVLEPQEYPAPEKDPKESYKLHYALIKAWYRDLWTALEGRGSDKQQAYLLKTIHGHIDQMRALVVPEDRSKLDQLEKLLSYYDSALTEALPLRNRSRIQSDLRAFDRMLRTLRFDKLQGGFVPMQ